MLLSVFAYAQETSVLDVEPGVTPDSPFYFFKTAFENIQLMLTFDKVEKAKLRYKLAKMRLAEALEMAKKNKTEMVDRLIERYEKMLNESLSELMEARKERNVTKVIDIISNSTLKHLFVLKKVYELAPPRAKPAIERAMRESMEGHKRVAELMDRRFVNVTIVIGNKTITEKVPVFLAEKFLKQAREFRKKMRERILEYREKLKEELMEKINITKEMAREQIEEVQEELAEFNTSLDIPAASVMLERARTHLANAIKAYEQGYYGRAYGLAVAAESILSALERMERGMEIREERMQELTEDFEEKIAEIKEEAEKLGITEKILPLLERAETLFREGKPRLGMVALMKAKRIVEIMEKESETEKRIMKRFRHGVERENETEIKTGIKIEEISVEMPEQP